MKTLEELQKDYNEACDIFEKVKKEHYTRIDMLKKGVIALAKYQIGDKVLCKTWHVRREEGIIRSIYAEKQGLSDNQIHPVYNVAKLTKAGVAHKTASLGYGGISEENVELMPTIQ